MVVSIKRLSKIMLKTVSNPGVQIYINIATICIFRIFSDSDYRSKPESGFENKMFSINTSNAPFRNDIELVNTFVIFNF